MGGVELEGGGAMPEAGVDAARVEAGPEGALDPAHAELHGSFHDLVGGDSFTNDDRRELLERLTPGHSQVYDDSADLAEPVKIRVSVPGGNDEALKSPAYMKGDALKSSMDDDALSEFKAMAKDPNASIQDLQHILDHFENGYKKSWSLGRVIDTMRGWVGLDPVDKHHSFVADAHAALTNRVLADLLHSEHRMSGNLDRAFAGRGMAAVPGERPAIAGIADGSLAEGGAVGLAPAHEGDRAVSAEAEKGIKDVLEAHAKAVAAREAPAEEADDRLAELTARLEKAKAEHEERLTAAAAPPPAVDEEEGDDDDGVPMTQDEINALLAKIDAEEDD